VIKGQAILTVKDHGHLFVLVRKLGNDPKNFVQDILEKPSPTTQVVDRKLMIPLSCVDARGKLYNSSPEST
jgi:hypothetical protein